MVVELQIHSKQPLKRIVLIHISHRIRRVFTFGDNAQDTGFEFPPYCRREVDSLVEVNGSDSTDSDDDVLKRRKESGWRTDNDIQIRTAWNRKFGTTNYPFLKPLLLTVVSI